MARLWILVVASRKCASKSVWSTLRSHPRGTSILLCDVVLCEDAYTEPTYESNHVTARTNRVAKTWDSGWPATRDRPVQKWAKNSVPLTRKKVCTILNLKRNVSKIVIMLWLDKNSRRKRVGHFLMEYWPSPFIILPQTLFWVFIQKATKIRRPVKDNSRITLARPPEGSCFPEYKHRAGTYCPYDLAHECNSPASPI